MTAKVPGGSAAIGTALPGLGELGGVDGRLYCLSSFDDRQLLVLVFLGNGCPTAKSCEDGLVELQAVYGPRGVGLVAINPNNPYLSPPDKLEEMARRARTREFNFPYLKDPQGALAAVLGVTRTPEACVLDERRVLRYRGRVFDTRDPSRAGRRDLQEAVDDLLSGRVVRVPETEAFGCSIIR